MKVWQVIPRGDKIDVGRRPDTALALFIHKTTAELVGSYLWGIYYEVKEIDLDADTYQEVFNCDQ